MGGNVSKQTQQETVAAWTLYGFGCSRCCNKAVFVAGAPRGTFCGTSCGRDGSFPPLPTEQAKLLSDLENDLVTAANQALPHLSWVSHVLFSQLDRTAEKAANALNNHQEGWCHEWNQKCLHAAGLHCVASSEIHGFGRSRTTSLVIRIVPRSK